MGWRRHAVSRNAEQTGIPLRFLGHRTQAANLAFSITPPKRHFTMRRRGKAKIHRYAHDRFTMRGRSPHKMYVTPRAITRVVWRTNDMNTIQR